MELFNNGVERTDCVSPISHLYVCLLLNPFLLPEGMQEEDKPAAEEEEEEDPEHGETSVLYIHKYIKLLVLWLLLL